MECHGQTLIVVALCVTKEGKWILNRAVVAENSTRCWPNLFITEIYNGMIVAFWLKK